MDALSLRSRKGFPSLPSRRPPQDRRTLPRNWTWRPFFDFFSFFFACKKTVKKLNVKNQRSLQFLTILGRSGVNFSPFLVPKQVPGGYFFGVVLKTVILSKSCSRCSGSTIFKGRALEKSVRRATPNGISAKHRRKTCVTPCADVLFQSRACFPSMFGAPGAYPKAPLSRQTRLWSVRTPLDLAGTREV